MELISCDSCGIVLDAKKLSFPKDIYDDDGNVDASKGIWVHRDYFPYVSCPHCSCPIPKE